MIDVYLVTDVVACEEEQKTLLEIIDGSVNLDKKY